MQLLCRLTHIQLLYPLASLHSCNMLGVCPYAEQLQHKVKVLGNPSRRDRVDPALNKEHILVIRYSILPVEHLFHALFAATFNAQTLLSTSNGLL